jgi:virginiamycin A acetyltransferase
MITIDSSARVSKLADIEDSVKGTKITIEAGVVVDSFVKIKPAGGDGDVVVGKNSIINSGCVIYTGNGVVIGANVAIAANCVFASVNHEYQDRTRLIREQRFGLSKGGIVIEDDVWVGAGCVLLDGTILRQGCVIGAMSLVRGEIPPYSVSVGNPLKLIGWRR